MPDMTNPAPAEALSLSPAPRSVLLLQGLMGPLFRRLGQGLLRAGHRVHKVNFNGGDRATWRLPGGIDYRGTKADWPIEACQVAKPGQLFTTTKGLCV